MKSLSTALLRAAAVAAVLPLMAVSATVTINGGTITFAPGSTTGGPFTQSLTVGSDPYTVAATYFYGATTSGGTTIGFFPTVTYTGTTPAATTDTINFDLTATISDPGATTWDGTYNENVPLIVPTNATGSGELFVDGQGVGLVGPYGPGTYNVSESANLTGLTGSTLNFSYDFTFVFAAGTVPGTSSSSPVVTPEPATMIPAALGLIGFGALALRRRKR